MAQYNLCEYSAARRTYEGRIETGAKGQATRRRALGSRIYRSGLRLLACRDRRISIWPKQVLERTIQPLKACSSMHGQAQAFNVLGYIEETQGAHAKAIADLQQALDMQSIITPRQPTLNAIVLQNIAAAESRSGDNRTAKQHLELALQILKKQRSVMLKARTYSGLGRSFAKTLQPGEGG